MKEVKVLAKDGQKLMSTDLERANKLIEKGEAKIVRAFPLTIQMLKGTKRYMQEILKEHYEFEESKNPLTIPLGKMNKNDEEKDFVWNLSSSEELENHSTCLLSIIPPRCEDVKKVFIENIIKHVENNSDDIDLILCDVDEKYKHLDSDKYAYVPCDRDISDVANVCETVQKLMMSRFKLMEEKQVNNITKVNGKVTGYEIDGKVYQWDKIHVNLDDDSFDNAKEVEVDYKPKNILLVISDIIELMSSADYKSVEKIKTALGSITRLGKAAGINVLIMSERMSVGVITSDLNYNIQLRFIVGDFDSGASQLMFEKDVSDEAKPEIKGRGFTQSNFRDIYEVQLFGDMNEEV